MTTAPANCDPAATDPTAICHFQVTPGGDIDSTKQQLLAAIDKIRALSASCDFGFTITGGTYSVDPTGRVTLNNVTSPSFVGALSFQLYLDGNGNALELGVDASEVTGAMAYAQTAQSADFEGAYAFAAQGFWTASSTVYPAWSAAGVTSISSDSVAGFSDYTMQNPDDSFTATPNVALSGGEGGDQGLLRLFGLNAGAFQTESAFGYYPIDGNRVIAIQVNGLQTGQQGVMMLEAVQSK